MEDDRVIVSGAVPMLLKVMEPDAISADLFEFKSPEQSAADRLLALAASVYSRWFLLMKSIMVRERAITRARIEEDTGKSVHGELTYSRATCEPQPLTAADEATMNALESTVRAVFGDNAADFAKDRFLRAIHTGDKRSFKIRFLFYKSCDGLKNTPLFAYFRGRLEDVVTEAEEAAGCTPDPSPRRMSLKEQERKRRREAAPKFEQLDLFDMIEHVGEEANEAVDGLVDASGDSGVDAADDALVGAVVPVGSDMGSAEEHSAVADAPREAEKGPSVPKGGPEGQKEREAPAKPAEVVRKTKAYESVAEIVADIQSGAITPYAKNDEVIADIKAKRITPAEAVLFLAELGKRSRLAFRTSGVASRLSRSESAKLADLEKADSPTDEDLDDIDNEDDDDEKDDSRQQTTLPSERGCFGDYEPRGRRRSGDEFGYDRDDDW